MLRRWCFIATQNFKLKNITRCELWKRQIPPWIVTLLFGTIQHWFCLFHSSHLVMCFNLKFCVAIKHHPLNIPHFFSIFLKLQNIFFSWFSPVSTECSWFSPVSPRCARDLSHAFWLARSQTTRIVRVHRWMLPDRTATLSPFDSTCSTWVSTVRMRRVAHASFSTRFSFKTGYRFSPLLSSVSRLFSQICMM